MKYKLYRTWHGNYDGVLVSSFWTAESAYSAMASLMKLPSKYTYFVEVPMYVDIWYAFSDLLNKR